jgi:hypothetical protein
MGAGKLETLLYSYIPISNGPALPFTVALFISLFRVASVVHSLLVPHPLLPVGLSPIDFYIVFAIRNPSVFQRSFSIQLWSLRLPSFAMYVKNIALPLNSMSICGENERNLVRAILRSVP